MPEYFIVRGRGNTGTDAGADAGAGDKIYTGHDKVAVYNRAFEKKIKIDPEGTLLAIQGGAATPSTDEFARLVARDAGLSNRTVIMLGELHEAIARAYTRVVDTSSVEHTLASTNSATFPHNYSDALIRVKSYRFDDYTGEGIQGFCPFEPVERIRQLLTFPVEKFGAPPHIEWGIARVELGVLGALDTSANTIARVRAVRPQLEHWQHYYEQVTRELARAVELLHDFGT